MAESKTARPRPWKTHSPASKQAASSWARAWLRFGVVQRGVPNLTPRSPSPELFGEITVENVQVPPCPPCVRVGQRLRGAGRAGQRADAGLARHDGQGALMI